MLKSKAIIVANGTPPSQALLTSFYDPATTLLVAADGGANCLYRYQLQPDYLIGDCDSVEPEVLNFMQTAGVVIERYPIMKEQTDSVLAVEKIKQLQLPQLYILGVFGGRRIDHLLANFGLLALTNQAGIIASLVDEYQAVSLLTSSTIRHGKTGQLFSLQSYGETIQQLTITGAKYPLINYQLVAGDSRTLANEFQETQVNLEFSNGRLLLFDFINNCC